MSEDETFPILNHIGHPLPAGNASWRLEEAAIVLAPQDNVAVARQDLARGAEIIHAQRRFVLRDRIGTGHKMAIAEIAQGSPVYKYAQVIGKALTPIQPGEWVHDHNLELAHDPDHYSFAVSRPRPPELPGDLPRTSWRYRRADGRVGTRTYIAVLATSNCSSHVCEGIAEEFRGLREVNVDGVVALPHQEGCSHHEGPDTQQLERTLRGIILNPNVAAVLVVALGCEVNSIARYVGPEPDTGRLKPLIGLEMQSVGGTLKTVAEGARKVRDLVDMIKTHRRTEEPVGQILLGLNCGGSDAFSGISANPALGYASDLLIASGGTVVLAETPEIYGAEQVLTERAVDVETGEKLLHIIRRYKEYVGRFGAILDSNPTPGNKLGGITNVVEKSLGAVMKGGTLALAGVVDYAEQVTQKGLVVMDTPGYDPMSITGIAAGGCNVIAFTTGRGSAIGFPIVPVLKIASNSRIFTVMNDNMDINAGTIVEGSTTVEQKGIEIYRHMVQVASGERTKSERLGTGRLLPGA